jgi:pyrroloquinoline quinone biosynthesis protein B
VLLTNADLDHILGLFSLREGNRLSIYASSAVRKVAATYLGLETALNTFCGSSWHEAPTGDFEPLSPKSGSAPNLLYRAIALPGNPPPFAKGTAPGGTHSLAYQFLDQRSGARLVVAPDVAAVNPGLLEALKNSDAILFDGTFWSPDELARVKPNARKAADMGHVTIQGGSLELLAKLTARRKIYIHINNTNPILAPNTPERAAVETAGITVGFDGLEFEL